MKSAQAFSTAAQLAIAALVLLGWLGGSLILAHAGFETSPRHGGTSTFVPLPQAYVLVAVSAYAGLAWWLVGALAAG